MRLSRGISVDRREPIKIRKELSDLVIFVQVSIHPSMASVL